MTDWRYSCGDGTVQAPEECDRDQCCASCYAVPSDYACNDGNLCTHTDVCDASGASPAATGCGGGGAGRVGGGAKPDDVCFVRYRSPFLLACFPVLCYPLVFRQLRRHAVYLQRLQEL